MKHETLTQQFLRISSALRTRGTNHPAKRHAYDVLADAVTRLPLDNLAGEVALEREEAGHHVHYRPNVMAVIPCGADALLTPTNSITTSSDLAMVTCPACRGWDGKEGR